MAVEAVTWEELLAAEEVAYAGTELQTLKDAREGTEATVNDVVLGLMGGTLRRYLEKHGGNPEEPLIAVCPVYVRTDEQRGEMNNKVSAMFTSLATDVDDPIERLRTINKVTRGAKEDHNALGANLLQDWAEHAAPATFAVILVRGTVRGSTARGSAGVATSVRRRSPLGKKERVPSPM